MLAEIFARTQADGVVSLLAVIVYFFTAFPFDAIVGKYMLRYATFTDKQAWIAMAKWGIEAELCSLLLLAIVAIIYSIKN